MTFIHLFNICAKNLIILRKFANCVMKLILEAIEFYILLLSSTLHYNLYSNSYFLRFRNSLYETHESLCFQSIEKLSICRSLIEEIYFKNLFYVLFSPKISNFYWSYFSRNRFSNHLKFIESIEMNVEKIFKSIIQSITLICLLYHILLDKLLIIIIWLTTNSIENFEYYSFVSMLGSINDLDDDVFPFPRYKPGGLDSLTKVTHFNKQEIRLMYQGFKQVSLRNILIWYAFWYFLSFCKQLIDCN